MIAIFGISVTLIGYFTRDGIMFYKIDADLYAATVKGVLFCVISAFLNSLGNVLQEKSFQSGVEIYELMRWRGIIGVIITGIEFYFLEFNDLINYKYTTKIILLITCATLTLLVFSIIVPFYIQRCTTGMFNICQASQIVWSFLINLLYLHENVYIT